MGPVAPATSLTMSLPTAVDVRTGRHSIVKTNGRIPACCCSVGRAAWYGRLDKLVDNAWDADADDVSISLPEADEAATGRPLLSAAVYRRSEVEAQAERSRAAAPGQRIDLSHPHGGHVVIKVHAAERQRVGAIE